MLRFRNDGGPLLLSPREPAAAWSGIWPPSDGRKVDATHRWLRPEEPATDYDRACEIEDGAALLTAGEGWVVVLTPSAEGAWLPDPPEGVGAVAIGVQDWTEELTPASAAALYARFAETPWQLLGDVRIGAGGVALLHAGGARGVDKEYAHDAPYERSSGEGHAVYIGDAIVFPLSPGRYRVESYEHLVRLGDHLALVRFIPQRT